MNGREVVAPITGPLLGHGRAPTVVAPDAREPAPRDLDRVRSVAWLRRGVSWLPGVLTLDRSAAGAAAGLGYVAVGAGSMGLRQLRRLGRRLQVPGLADRLSAGESTELFHLPLDQLECVRFPWYEFDGAIYVRLSIDRQIQLRLHFSEPPVSRGDSRTLAPLYDLGEARSVGLRWRDALETVRALK